MSGKDNKAQSNNLKGLRSGSQATDSPRNAKTEIKGRESRVESENIEGATAKSNESEIKKFRKEMKDYFENMDKNMDDRFTKMDEKFTRMFDSLTEEVVSMKNEMTETKGNVSRINTKVDEMETKVDDIEKSVEFQAGELADLKKDLRKERDERFDKVEKDLDKKINDLNSKLQLLEKHDRKYNLLFYGIKEEPNEDVFDKIKGILCTDMKIEEERVERIYFAHGHRLPTEGQGPRPIIIRFTAFEDRELILSKAKLLAGSRRRILVDLPVVMKKERDRLAKVAFEIRQKEKLQTRIIDRGLNVHLQVRKDTDSGWAKWDV